MATEAETVESQADGRWSLLSQRHPTHDLFICDVLDAIPKDDMASMEHPIFSLATKPDTRILKYEHKNVLWRSRPVPAAWRRSLTRTSSSTAFRS